MKPTKRQAEVLGILIKGDSIIYDRFFCNAQFLFKGDNIRLNTFLSLAKHQWVAVTISLPVHVIWNITPAGERALEEVQNG